LDLKAPTEGSALTGGASATAETTEYAEIVPIQQQQQSPPPPASPAKATE